jgi:hypothetical protein
MDDEYRIQNNESDPLVLDDIGVLTIAILLTFLYLRRKKDSENKIKNVESDPSNFNSQEYLLLVL